jgi:hypothetical protein
VAETREEYVDRAVRLGASAANRQAARAAIRQVEARAYGDVDAVRALTGVLLESDPNQFVLKP